MGGSVSSRRPSSSAGMLSRRKRHSKTLTSRCWTHYSEVRLQRVCQLTSTNRYIWPVSTVIWQRNPHWDLGFYIYIKQKTNTQPIYIKNFKVPYEKFQVKASEIIINGIFFWCIVLVMSFFSQYKSRIKRNTFNVNFLLWNVKKRKKKKD